MLYRHGLRVSEAVELRIKDLDLKTSRLWVGRLKGSLSTHQPVEGDGREHHQHERSERGRDWRVGEQGGTVRAKLQRR